MAFPWDWSPRPGVGRSRGCAHFGVIDRRSGHRRECRAFPRRGSHYCVAHTS